MNRYFKNNTEYFNFINKYKDMIHVIRVAINKNNIRVQYEISQNQ